MPRPSEEENLKKIVRALSVIGKWGTQHLPCNYLVLDIETTGFSSVDNRVVSVGFCAVKDCEITNEIHAGNYSNVILKWPEDVFVGCEKASEIHGIDYQKSQELGTEPHEAMEMVHEAIEWARSEDMYIVGHNMQKFDAPFLSAELSRAGIGTRIHNDEVVDTAALCKAMQLGMIPSQDETVFDYFNRVMSFRAKGVYFNLDRYCCSRFSLDERFGARKEDAHNSGYDCWLTHLVMLSLNQMLGCSYTPVDETMPF